MRTILKHILAVLDEKEKKRFGILSMLDIIISIVDIFSLALLLWIVRFYIQPEQDNGLSYLPGLVSGVSPVLLIATFVLLFGIKNWLGYIIARAQFRFISKIAIRISKKNLADYQEASFLDFVNIDSSAHIRRIAFQPFEFSQYILSGVQQIITQLSLILVAIIAIVLFNVKLFVLLLLILLPPVIIVSYFIKKRLSAAKKHIQESNQRSFQYLLDALKGYVESNIYHRNAFFLERYTAVRKQFSTHLFDSLALQTMPGRIIEIFAVLGLFILIVIAKWTGNNDSNTLITIGAFMAAAYKIIPGIVKIINTSGQMKAYESELIRPVKNDQHKPSQSAGRAKDIQSIEFKNVSFSYQQQPVLNNLSFTLNKGDFMGITGESGKGKTTIINLLLGFLPAEIPGSININDAEIEAGAIKDHWPSISYTRQQKFFINDSILKNITLEETGFDKEQLEYALKISGLDKVIMKFPEGLEKIITENGKNISGGQQQRVALARALYKKNSLLILDEPFNELDEEGTAALLEHLRQLAEAGKIIVMVTHDKKSLSWCNKIISLDQ